MVAASARCQLDGRRPKPSRGNDRLCTSPAPPSGYYCGPGPESVRLGALRTGPRPRRPLIQQFHGFWGLLEGVRAFVATYSSPTTHTISRDPTNLNDATATEDPQNVRTRHR